MVQNNSHNICTVKSLQELFDTAFEKDINAVCLKRDLKGDFSEIVNKLELNENITEIPVSVLKALILTEEGNLARATILNDFEKLSQFGAQPTLNLLKCYDRDKEFDFISTDVYSFHVDRSPTATDTYLCTYLGEPSDILSNDEAEQKILIPEVSAKLKELHHGREEEFEDFVKENFFDLHYQAKPNAKPISLGLGNLWKLAVDHPYQEVPPCIHRAPIEKQGEYRLLLIC